MSDIFRVSIATGLDPVRALALAVAALPDPQRKGWRVGVAHDDECPCADGHDPMPDCTCEIVDLIARRLT